MVELACLLVVAAFPFGFAALRGAPFVPTLHPLCEEMLDLVPVGVDTKFADLGSGDGRLLVAAAKRGAKAIGIESNPILWAVSVVRTVRYRRLIKIYFGSFWDRNIPEADVIYAFLGEKYMYRLDRKIQAELTKPVLLVANTFPVPGKIPMRPRPWVYLYAY
jgi:hypothetical protein